MERGKRRMGARADIKWVFFDLLFKIFYYSYLVLFFFPIRLTVSLLITDLPKKSLCVDNFAYISLDKKQNGPVYMVLFAFFFLVTNC
jgi:hypothetical protein